jgi:WD40 repeat protein
MSPDGAVFAAISRNGTILLSETTNTLGEITELKGNAGSVASVVFTYDGSKIKAGCMDGHVYTWELSMAEFQPSTDLNLKNIPPLVSYEKMKSTKVHNKSIGF